MKPVVLIADDSMVVRAFLRKQLSAEDYELVEADGGEAALELCRQRRPHLVLLDVEMPGLSGYDVLTTMQADPDLASTPVIFLSGRVSAADVATGLRMGARDYLRKPVETGELLARVAKAIETRAGEEMAEAAADEPLATVGGGSSIDPVTGVLDYGGLEAAIRKLTAAGEAERSLAAVILDVARLSAVNADHGHAAGDQVLRAVATVLRERVGPRDTVGRVGADQFLVLLPDVGTEEAERLGSAVKDAIDRSPALGAGPLGVGVSMAAAASTSADIEGLFKSLEFKLALAKTQAAGPPPEPVAPAPTQAFAPTLSPPPTRSAAPAPVAARPDLPPPPTPPPANGRLPSWLEETRAAAPTRPAPDPVPSPPAPPAPAPAPKAAPPVPPAVDASEKDVDDGDETQTGRFRRWIRPK